MDILLSVFLGIIGSIIASAIIWFCHWLLSPPRRSFLDMKIDAASLSINQLESAIKYDQYDLAVSEANIIFNTYLDIYANIGRATYTPSKKRFIVTLLINSLDFCEHIKNIEIGLSLEDEASGRCQRISRWLFRDDIYSVTRKSVLSLQNDWLRMLNQNKNINRYLSRHTSKDYKAELQLLLLSLDPRCYKAKNMRPYDKRQHGFTQIKTERYMSKLMK